MHFDYQRKKGLLFPILQISKDKADDERPVGKYAMMWLKFMHEYNNDRYTELLMNGTLLHIAHKINDEAFEQIKVITKESNDITNHQLAEQQVIREFVLIKR